MANKTNPRHKNGNLRRKHRARLKAMALPCGICQGRLGPIHYDEPSDAQHPLSFVIDEIRPVSKWKLFGYDSPEAAAQDWDNLQPAHWICNQAKSDRVAGQQDSVGENKNILKKLMSLMAIGKSLEERWGGYPLGTPWRDRAVQRRFTHKEFLV